MTAAKSTLRRRRASVNDVPRDLAEWFAGERTPGPRRNTVPWSALLVPDFALLPERWRAWSADNPGVAPPPGFEWLDDPTSTRHPGPHELEQAREMLARTK